MSDGKGYVELRVADGTTMRAYTARPLKAGAKAGMIVLQEAYGVNAHIRDVTERFSGAGFAAIAPELFHRAAPGFEGHYDMPKDEVMRQIHALTPEGQTADVKAAYDWLLESGQAAEGRIAAVGYCMGGRAAFLANATLPLAGAISYYGGGIAPGLLERVRSLSGPQLLFWGGKDGNIPPEQYRAVEDALREQDKAYVSVVFSGAKHGFFNDQRPQYDPDAARESWALLLRFLEDHVTAPEAAAGSS